MKKYQQKKKLSIIKKTMDKFYTSDKLAHQCVDSLNIFLQTLVITKPVMFLEPSCGQGAFFKFLNPNARLGYEIDPQLCAEHKDYICQDFLQVQAIPRGCFLIAIGNPPFSFGNRITTGRKKNIQAEFINKCEQLGCNVVAFIVGASMHRLRSNSTVKNLIIARSTFLPDTQFLLPDGSVKTFNVYFDIYVRAPTPVYRSLQQLTRSARPWQFSNSDNYDLAFERWGCNVGRIKVYPPVSISLHCPTLSRYFYVRFDVGFKRRVFDLFLIEVNKYVRTIRTITSSSISMYEVYSLWNTFVAR